MLVSASVFANQLKALPTTKVAIEGVTQFVGALATFLNQIQAGPTGSPGIFTYTQAPVIAALVALPPVMDNSWVVPFANAIHLGTLSAILVPGTVMNPAWTVSVVDTIPPTITTLDAALALLISGLMALQSSDSTAPLPLAQAFHDYASAFIFLCTGIGGTVITPVPIPIPIPGQ